jgi:hypothetical protein
VSAHGPACECRRSSSPLTVLHRVLKNTGGWREVGGRLAGACLPVGPGSPYGCCSRSWGNSFKESENSVFCSIRRMEQVGREWRADDRERNAARACHEWTSDVVHQLRRRRSLKKARRKAAVLYTSQRCGLPDCAWGTTTQARSLSPVRKLSISLSHDSHSSNSARTWFAWHFPRTMSLPLRQSDNLPSLC